VSGTSFDLDNGSIISKQFAIDSSGNASFGGTIVGGALDIPNATSANSWHVDSSGNMWSGANVANKLTAPFRVSNAGAIVASSVTLTNASIGLGSSYTGNQIAEAYIGNLNASKITAGTIDASVITVTNLNASNLTSGTVATGRLTADNIQTGTLTVGSGVGTAQILFNQSLSGGGGTTSAYLRWSGGSKIWSDTANLMGYNAIGGQHYFYTANNENVVIRDGLQTIFQQGVSVRNSFNVGIPGSTVVHGHVTGQMRFDPAISSASTPYITGTTSTLDIRGFAQVEMFVNNISQLRLGTAGGVFSTTSQVFMNWIRGTGALVQVGSITDKWRLFGTVFACPLPVTSNALEKLGTTTHKKLAPGEGHYGDDIEYLDIPEALPEMKETILDKETGKDREDIEITKTVGFLYSCIKELHEELKLLKAK
jgi:hypothetical protein